MPVFSTLFEDLVGLLFPKLCLACSQPLARHEKVLCSHCLYHLPRTQFQVHKENPVKEIFDGRLILQSATAFLFFNKGGNVQHLIHQLKYKGQKEVGLYLGELFGNELNESPLYQDADYLIPVPLHPVKERKRGYNQSRMIARGMETTMQASLADDILFRQVHSSTQTKKSRFERWENVKDIFALKNEARLEGKHVILIDDVITTGSTIEACGNLLQKIPGIRISVSALAYSQG
ncbi:MAG: ComF family protein [Bacteroidales bacterium]|nr:ComF family protein [Bacteroidales bacterium]